MTNNTRQEAVERAAEALHMLGGVGATDAPERYATLAIDASGLIEQLTEAIAQRDEAGRERDMAYQDWQLEIDALREQLAAERALCDRLARYARDPLQRGPGDILRAYDAHRATERANTEEYGGFGGLNEG